jgi:DedD protein
MAANQLSEQEIQFRKRARRRLVGAVALVLLMVTVLPMVLDDREIKPAPQDIAISIPSQDGGNFTSRIVPLPPQTSAPGSAVNVELSGPLDKPKSDEQSKSVEVPAPKKEPAKVEVVPAKNPEPVTKPAPEIDAPVKPAEPAKTVKEAPKPTVVAAKPAAKKGAFSVQIGVFTEGPKIKELQSKLAAEGFHPSTEKLDTPKGVKVRLRVGPYATRQDAEAALGKLKAAGTQGMVVTNK